PLPQDLHLRFIFPHAPVRPVTINNGHEMRAWYDIKMNDISRVPDEAGIRESQASIEALIAREEKRGVSADRIVLAGFSQGGAIALQAGLRHRERLAGIVALSTYLPLEDSLDREAAAANKRTPIFMAHGTQDPVIPVQLAEASKRALEQRGYDVAWQTWPMPHSVCAEEVEELGGFFIRAYGGSRDNEPRSSTILLAR
ncbi:MAG TPA: alpha/beta fold hydrolase, partial [Usitatibacter sp.]|nr:alpha/beta fold hydrolase [Usitatibacter sp.]